MSIFKACDVRGVVGDQWNESDARRIGQSLAQMLMRRGERYICVGGDFRRSTPSLTAALKTGLISTGVNVIDVGQGPTPMIYFAARHLGVGSAAIVTASHNPGRYNGVKFLVQGRPAIPRLVAELESGMSAEPAASEPGAERSEDVAEAYEEWLLKKASEFAAASTAGGPALGCVVDPMTGAMCGVAGRVMEAAGYRVQSIRDSVDPDFATCDPNPAKDANLTSLIDRVREENANFGFALDGDGDRVVFVDERGEVIRPEQVGALLATQCFDKPTLVYDLKCASVLPRVVENAGGKAIMQPSGHGFIKSAIIDRHADLGVEVSGHHFYGGDMRGGDDGLLTALVVGSLIRRSGVSLSGLIEPFSWPAITPDLRIRYDGDAAAAVEAIAAACDGQLERMDGVRAQYEHGWALARASITEPAITLRFEGQQRGNLREIAYRFLAPLPELRKRVLEMIDA